MSLTKEITSTRGFWRDPGNVEKFLTEFAKKLKFKSLDDWYQITAAEVEQSGGSGLINLFKGSLSKALIATFPNHDWQMWRFPTVPKNFWVDKANRRKFFDDLTKKLNITDYQQWYNVSNQEIMEAGGSGCLSTYYNNSLYKALRDIYPELPFEYEKFVRSESPAYWKSEQKQRELVEKIGEELGVKTLNDWYSISPGDFKAKGGTTVLGLYENSIAKMLIKLFPTHPWRSEQFSLDSNNWRNIESQKKVMDEIAKKLNIKEWRDWYRVKSDDIMNNGGAGILSLYKHSLFTLLKTVYPENEWQKKYFFSNYRELWINVKQQRDFLDKVAKEIGIKEWHDWTKVPHERITERGGYGLLQFFEGDLNKALRSAYPDYPWDSHVPEKPSQSILNNKNHQKQILERIGEKLGIKQLDDWYKIRQDEFLRQSQGFSLLSRYNNSIYQMLKEIYPEHNWIPYKMESLPRNFWDTRQNIVEFLEFVTQKLRIKKPEDWMRVSIDDINQLGGRFALRKVGGSIHNLLLKAYPEDESEILELLQNRPFLTESQRQIFGMVQSLFPDLDDIEISYKHPTLKLKSGKALEFDVYITSLHLGFTNLTEANVTSEYLITLDEEKRSICQANQITLIQIPYNWDKSIKTLYDKIRIANPNINVKNPI